MKRTLTIVLAIGIALSVAARAARATVIDLELYNTNPILDNDNSTPLLGDLSSGDLVQLILTPNDAVNAPDQFGNAAGGDIVLFSGHIGLGMPANPNQGFIDVYPITYDSTWGGYSNVYVRFFDATTAAGAQWYGNSSIYTLPVGDVFNQASLDFAPSTSPYANLPANFIVVPEPSSLFVYGLGFLAISWFYKKKLWKTSKA